MTKTKNVRVEMVPPEKLIVARSPDHPRFMGEPIEGGGYTFGRTHPLYLPSGDYPDNHPEIVALRDSMKALGKWLGGVILAREEGEHFVVEEGRKRTLAAQLAGIPEIPVMISDDDNFTAFTKAIGLNNLRGHVDSMTQAREIMKLQQLAEEQGVTLKLKDVARMYGWTHVDTVKNKLKMLTAAPPVQKALQEGRITDSDVLRMVTKPAEKQVEMLAKIPKKDPNKPKARRKANKSDNTGPRKPTAHQAARILDEVEQNSPQHYMGRLLLGLVGLKTAAPHIGLDTKSDTYKDLINKLKKEE